MILTQLFLLTIRGLRQRPLRSWLTILGIVIAIMLVVIIFSLGSGIQSAVKKTLQVFGSDLVVVMPGKETNPLTGFIGGQAFKEQDILGLERIRDVEFAVPMEIGMMNVEHRGEKKTAMLHAASWKHYAHVLEMSQGYRLKEGRWPRTDQEAEIVLGYQAANSLFKTPVRLGDEIIVKSKHMVVVGIMLSVGEQMIDNVMFVSMNIFRNLSGTRADARSALVKIRADADVDLVSKEISFQLSKQSEVRDFTILTPQKADRIVGNVLTLIELTLLGIAFISLAVGAVGITNTMYTSVLERTRQIGLMKAIGATREAILALFLIESGLIGVAGGLLGVATGIAISFIIGQVVGNLGIRGLFSFAAVDYWGLAALIVFTFLVGILSGFLPARKAARLEPAEALRYE